MTTHTQLLAQLATLDDEVPLDGIRFYAIGTTVMVRSETTDGQWCVVEPLHDTEQARRAACGRARQTAAALNELYRQAGE